ncbi:MAG: LamG domain-containing protein [Phycisphaeraceae bacterium]|nr:LamG domain-containing protein [Phycisphaeraceae bacterium]
MIGKTHQGCIGLGVLALALLCGHADAALVAQWNFDDNTYNDQVGSLHGTANGATSIVAAGNNQLGNDMGKALQTGATAGTDYLETGDLNTLGNTGDYTVTAWLKHSTVGAAVSPEWWDTDVSGTGGAGGGFLGTIRRNDGTGNTALVYANHRDTTSGALKLLKPSPRVDDGLWHFIAITYTPGGAFNSSIYLDGVLSGDHELGTFTLSMTDGGKIMRLGDGFDGMIDDVRVYSHALEGALDGNNTLISGELYDVWHAMVPEPAALALAVAGASVLLVRRK